MDTAIGTVNRVTAEGVRIAWGDGSVIDEKYYKTLASYSPAVDDRILAIRMSGTYLILGKIAY